MRIRNGSGIIDWLAATANAVTMNGANIKRKVLPSSLEYTPARDASADDLMRGLDDVCAFADRDRGARAFALAVGFARGRRAVDRAGACLARFPVFRFVVAAFFTRNSQKIQELVG